MSKLINARYVLLTLAALVGIVIAVLIGLQIQVARQETIQTGTRSARNLASTLAQHTRQSLRAVDLILQVLSGPDVVPPLLDPSRKAQSHQVLRNRAASAEGVFAIIVFDKNGRIVSSSFEDDPEPRDLSDRPAFIAAREGREFTVAPPHRSQIGPAAGKLVMIITRRIESRDGQFLGTVEGSLSVDSFVNFYRSLDMGAQGIISVLRHDGTVLLRYPLEENLLGRSVSNPVFRAYLSGQGSGEVFSTYVTDNIVRLTAFRDVPEIDLVVSVGLSLDDLLAGWKRTAFTEAAAAAVVIMVLILLMLLANRYLSGRERERERFAVRLNRLATASSEIASIHTGAGLVAGLRRTVQELVPGAVAEVRFALERTGAQREPVIEARRITLPLQAKGGRVLGTLDVTRAEGPLLSSQDTAVLSQIALIGTVALENVELLAESHRLAVQAERARAEEAEARHQIEDVFATMSEGVYTLDHSWRFTFLNDNALALIARPREDLIGRVIWDVVPTASPIQKRFERVAKEQVPVEFEYEYETGTGTRWADVRAFPTIDGISVYIRDITQRVETESKLRQAQKMQAIGQLTGGIAHDFNNLLTVVLGNVDLLVDALDPQPRLKRIAEVARDAAVRGATLVARLLAFARRQALAPRPVDVNVLTRSVEDLLHRTIGEAVSIKLQRSSSLWRASIDPTQMENALLNLALNARDAMPNGGMLTIETSNAHLDGGQIDDTPIVAGDYVMVAVGDTGTGMTNEVRSRAFDPFFTTKAVGAGSGLGLSMVYGFVRQSGGYVRIDTEVGQGTTVRMYLPRAQEDSLPQAVIAGPGVIPTGRETILLVEDDELVREHLSETLKSLGYGIIPCSTGPEAIKMVDDGVQADLLLTDIMLAGGINGRGVAQRVKQLRPEMPVLYMSGYSEEAIIHDGKLDAGIHFISKPFRRQDIAVKLREVLGEAVAPVA